MTSSLNKILNGKFNNLKQIGPKSWLLCDENGKSYVLNRFMTKNQKAEDAYKINEILFKNPNNSFKNSFLFYEQRILIDEFSYVLVEYCREGDLNKFLSENRFKKQESDEQIKNWILQLLRAIEFLNRNRILHKKLCTYTIFVHNGHLKIDGFEHAQKVSNENSTVQINLDENYGIFNSPEIVKLGKINFKYHVWCIGWIIYEICTCEWKHYSLLNQNFDDWKAPSLPENYSKSLSYLFKKMIKPSPTSRLKPERLIKTANEYFSRDKLIRKKSEDKWDSLNFRDYLLKAFDQRFETFFESRDEDEHLSDSDDENNSSKSDLELDVSDKFKDKNRTYKGKINDYKVKQVIKNGEHFADYLTITKNKKRRLLRIIKYNSNNELKKDLTYLRDIQKRMKDLKNPFITLNDDFFDLNHRLCFSSEVFEEGTLAELIQKFIAEHRSFCQDKIFDFLFYLINGVCFLHENRIIHRDIKPSNIYLRNEKLKIGNIGVDYLIQNELSLIDDKEKDKMPCYFSPELVVTFKGDNRCDIWSIGCVIYEMLTLEHLFFIQDLKYIISFCQFPRPELNCRKKIKNLFYSLIKPVNERPTAIEVSKHLDEMIKKERETYENPRTFLDSE